MKTYEYMIPMPPTDGSWIKMVDVRTTYASGGLKVGVMLAALFVFMLYWLGIPA